MGCFIALTKSWDANVFALAYYTLGIFKFSRKFHGVINYLWSCFFHKHFVAYIVLQCRTDVRFGYSVFSPCFTLRWFFMWEYFVPGGTMGVGLKSNCPSICAYTDNLEFVLDVINKLIFISACFTIRHQEYIGFFCPLTLTLPHNHSWNCI